MRKAAPSSRSPSLHRSPFRSPSARPASRHRYYSRCSSCRTNRAPGVIWLPAAGRKPEGEVALVHASVLIPLCFLRSVLVTVSPRVWHDAGSSRLSRGKAPYILSSCEADQNRQFGFPETSIFLEVGGSAGLPADFGSPLPLLESPRKYLGVGRSSAQPGSSKSTSAILLFLCLAATPRGIPQTTWV